MPFDLSQSPRTQSMAMMGGEQPQATAEDLFRQGFTDMAYDALRRSNPELLPDVITFRTLEVDPSRGMGVGAFVLSTHAEILYIPAIISDNNLKPLDLFYSRRLDRYYPLKKEWLQEASKGTLGQLGSAVEPPRTLQTDVDIRSMVVPPTTGRYSYASDTQAGAAWAIASALRDDRHEKRALMLPTLMTKVPNGVKTAMSRILQRRPKLGQAMVECYGRSNVRQMLEPHAKKAALRLETPADKNVMVLHAATPIQDLRRIAGDDTAQAYRLIRQHGFYVKDTRKSTDALVELATTDSGLIEPTDAGMYRVYLTNGKVEEAFIVPDPKPLGLQKSDEEKIRDSGFRTDRHYAERMQTKKNYLVIFKDGRYARPGHIVVEPLPSASHATLEEHLRPLLADSPREGEEGCFISTAQVTLKATEPCTAMKVNSTPEETHVKTTWSDTVIQSKKLGGNAVIKPVGSTVTTLPATFRWCRFGKQVRNDEIYASPSDVMRSAEAALLREGAKPVTVKQAGRQLQVGTSVLPFPQAIEKIAQDFNLNIQDTTEVVKLAMDRQRPHRLYSVPRQKLAANGGGQPPPQDPSMDPNAAAMMAPPGPPPPTGVDLAIAEQMQQIQMQMQALQDKANALQMVQQRAQQIDMGGGAMAAPMGAASLQGGPAQPMPGMPPQGMPPQGMAPQGMGPQGMPPQGMGPQGMPGAAPPPMDAGMQGMGMQGMQDMQGMQGMEEPPPQASLDDNQLTPELAESQINPQFLDQAQELNDEQVFDAAAVASIVNMKDLSQLATAYVPNLEKALDNLGRLRLQFAIKEPEFKKMIGTDEYLRTEQNMKDVFNGLGDAIMNVNRATMFSSSPMPT